MKAFYIKSLENIGNSFVIGTGTRLIYKIVNSNCKSLSDRCPDMYTFYECLRAGYEMGKYTLVYCVNYFLLSCAGFEGYPLSLISVYGTSFFLGLQKGLSFATKNGLVSVFTSLTKNFLNY